MIPNYAIDENLKVEFLLPDPFLNLFVLGISELGMGNVLGQNNSFVLGVSLLGGDNVLGSGNGFSWQELTCSVSDADISIGGAIQDAIYFQPEPATANLTLQGLDYDPTNNPFMRAGTKLRVRVESVDVDRILFQGYIDTINVTYYPNGQNLIQITAFDVYKRLVNSTFAVWDTTSGDPYTYDVLNIIKVAEDSGLGVSPLSQAIKPLPVPEVSETNVSVSSVLNEAVQIALAVIWIDQDTEQLVYIPRIPQIAGGAPEPDFIISADHAPGDVYPYHLCLGEINVFADQDAFFNSLKITLASDDTKVLVRKDQDSIDLYGESAVDVTLNVWVEGVMSEWADNVFRNRTANLVNQVMTPSLDRLGTLTNAAVFTPGTRIRVQYTKNNYNIDGVYTIIKVNHRIDVDNWFTTFELWKEA
jgi:hypothetical protein